MLDRGLELCMALAVWITGPTVGDRSGRGHGALAYPTSRRMGADHNHALGQLAAPSILLHSLAGHQSTDRPGVARRRAPAGGRGLVRRDVRTP
jgi:hypothetical protein